MKSRRPSLDSKNRPSYHAWYWEWKGELSRETRVSESSENKSNTSPTLTSPTTSLARFFQSSRRKQSGSTQGQGLNSEQKKSTTPDLSSNSGKMKANSQSVRTVLTTSFASFVHAATSPRTVQNPLGFCQSRSSKLIRTICIFLHRFEKDWASLRLRRPEDCIELPRAKTLPQLKAHPLSISRHPTPLDHILKSCGFRIFDSV